MNCWSLIIRPSIFTVVKRGKSTPRISTGRCGATCRSRPNLSLHDTIDYGWDEDGAGVHDGGSRCDPYTNYLMTGGGESQRIVQPTRQALRDNEGNGRATSAECFQCTLDY
jgi:hypothetical protein